MAKPFLVAHSNPAAATGALSQLLAVCLKKSSLPTLLADIIHAVVAEAAEAAVSMLADVADCILLKDTSRSHVLAGKQKDQTADMAQQQTSAVSVMLEYARKGGDEQELVLEMFFCMVRPPLSCDNH